MRLGCGAGLGVLLALTSACEGDTEGLLRRDASAVDASEINPPDATPPAPDATPRDMGLPDSGPPGECVLTAVPVDLGAVRPGAVRRLAVPLTNQGREACRVEEIRGEGLTVEAFSSVVEPNGRGLIQLLVQSPLEGPRRLEGSVPTPNGPAPLQVELNASTTTMVAIAPDYLDLSDGCTTTRRTLRVANVGPATRRVEALRWAPRIPGLAASPTSFELPSESFAEILIEGRVSGPFASTLTIELDDGTTLAASVFSHGRREKVHEHITLGRDERDMFWIFDDSGSMSDEQRLIAELLGGLSELRQQNMAERPMLGWAFSHYDCPRVSSSAVGVAGCCGIPIPLDQRPTDCVEVPPDPDWMQDWIHDVGAFFSPARTWLIRDVVLAPRSIVFIVITDTHEVSGSDEAGAYAVWIRSALGWARRHDVTVVAGGYHEVLGGPNYCGERNPRDCTYLNLLSSEDLVSMAFGDRALLLLEMPADAGRAVLVEVDGVPRTDGRLVQDGRGISFPTSALVPGGAEITVEYVARCDE